MFWIDDNGWLISIRNYRILVFWTEIYWSALLFRSQIISGQYLTQNVGSTTSVYIEVELLGIPIDSMSRKTKPSVKNSLNPIWQETFVFQVRKSIWTKQKQGSWSYLFWLSLNFSCFLRNLHLFVFTFTMPEVIISCHNVSSRWNVFGQVTDMFVFETLEIFLSSWQLYSFIRKLPIRCLFEMLNKIYQLRIRLICFVIKF